MKRKISLIIFGFLTTWFAISVTQNNNFEIKGIFNQGKELPLISLIISIIFYNLSIILRAVRINYFLKKHSSFLEILKLQYITTGFQLFVPFRLGDGIRIIFFKKKFGNLANSTFIFFIEKIFDLVILFFLLFISGILLNLFDIYTLINQNSILVMLSFIILFISLISTPISKTISTKNKFKKPIKNLIHGFNKYIGTFSFRKLIKTFFITMIIWIFDNLSFFFVIDYFKQNFLYHFLLGPLTALSSILPSPPMGFYGSINIGFYWLGELAKIKSYTNLAPLYSIFIYGTTIFIAFLIFSADKMFSIYRKN